MNLLQSAKNFLQAHPRESAIYLVVFTFLSLAIGVTDHSANQLAQTITSEVSGHLSVHRRDFDETALPNQAFRDLEMLAGVISSVPEIQSWTPRLYAHSETESQGKALSLRVAGVDIEMDTITLPKRHQITSNSSTLESFTNGSILISDELRQKLSIQLYEKMALKFQPADSPPIYENFEVAGFFSPQRYHSDAIITVEDLQNILSLRGYYHEILIRVRELEYTQSTRTKLQAQLPPSFEVTQWESMKFNGDLEKAIQSKTVYILWLAAALFLGAILREVFSLTQRIEAVRTQLGKISFGGRFLRLVRIRMSRTAQLAVFGVLVSLGINLVFSLIPLPLLSPLSFYGVTFEQLFSSPTPVSVFLPICITLFPYLLLGVILDALLTHFSRKK